MKKCTGCQQSLSIDMFGWKNKEKTLRHARCNICRRQYNRNWYERNSHQQLFAVQRRTQLAREWKFNYLVNSGGCSIEECNVVNPLMLEFDHIDRINKNDAISRMVAKGYNLEKIKEEARKCRILCANHHKMRTAEQFDTWSYKEWLSGSNPS